MPRLTRIVVYPIKSFDGAEAAQATFNSGGGLQYDRRFALRDPHGDFVNGKRFPAIHALRATYDTRFATIVLEGPGFAAETFDLVARNPVFERRLSDYFGLPIRLAEDADCGFPDDPASPGPTIVSTPTLAAVTRWFPQLDLAEVRRRFRVNLEVDGSANDPCPAFWEDRLFAADAEPGCRNAVAFRIGSVMLEGVNPCGRCVVPTRDSQSGRVTPRFVADFQSNRAAELPSWAQSTAFDHFYRLSVNTRPTFATAGGTIRLGDEIQVV